MPSSAKSLPPKSCPVCDAPIWTSKWSLPSNVRQVYKTHVEAKHPAYEEWSRRSGLTYFLALIPFFGFAISAASATSASNASILAILMFPSAFAVIIIVWAYHHSIKTSFHQSWIREHGADPVLRQN